MTSSVNIKKSPKLILGFFSIAINGTGWPKSKFPISNDCSTVPMHIWIQPANWSDNFSFLGRILISIFSKFCTKVRNYFPSRLATGLKTIWHKKKNFLLSCLVPFRKMFMYAKNYFNKRHSKWLTMKKIM